MVPFPELNREQWSDLIKRLDLYAAKLILKLTWNTGAPPGGKKPEDYVQKAIMDTLTGRRKYNSKITERKFTRYFPDGFSLLGVKIARDDIARKASH